MPVSIILKYGTYQCAYLEAYTPGHEQGRSPWLYSDYRHAPIVASLLINMAPPIIIADAIDDFIGDLRGWRIGQLSHYLRTGEHPWATARATISARQRRRTAQGGGSRFSQSAAGEAIERGIEDHARRLSSE